MVVFSMFFSLQEHLLSLHRDLWLAAQYLGSRANEDYQTYAQSDQGVR